jgi:DNA-directed RNA polymerase subunit omega
LSVARITIEDCLKEVPNRFLLVHMTAKRVRQIREGHEYLISSPKNEDIVVALREIAAGKVKLEYKKSKQALPEPEPEREAEEPALIEQAAAVEEKEALQPARIDQKAPEGLEEGGEPIEPAEPTDPSTE